MTGTNEREYFRHETIKGYTKTWGNFSPKCGLTFVAHWEVFPLGLHWRKLSPPDATLFLIKKNK